MHDINQPGINKPVNKPVQKVSFSRKLQKTNHPSLKFNGISVTYLEIQKHLGMFLDSKLDFKEHIQIVLVKQQGCYKFQKKFTKTFFNNIL